MLVICINGITIGVETELGDGSAAWEVMEALFLACYTFELLIRLKADGFVAYRHDNWMRFDTAVLLVAYFDICIIGPAMKSGNSGTQKIVILLRMMRLLKLARLVRLLRFFKELWLLVASFGSAFKTLAWTFVLLVLVLYVFGIIFVWILGKDSSDKDIKEWFGSLPGAMFTLFQIMTLEAWAEIARSVWETEQWYMTFTILIFIGICSFAIMNTVMAVIVEHTLGEAMEQRDELIKKAEKELHEAANGLLEMFKSADTDRSGLLGKDEFVAALTGPEARRLLQQLDVGEDFSVLAQEEIGLLFDTIDVDGSNGLNPQEFVDGMMQMRGPARSRRVFELHCNLMKMRLAMQTSHDHLQEQMNGMHQAFRTQANAQREVVQALEAKVDSNMLAISSSLAMLTHRMEAIAAAVGARD
eukprot:gnl/MRDRNA2_/MRDRNA2_123006_c0_seq1.p1 gnl/MRDRNA2_/MRDRNA2_123006_c0~~gnl/MRDRNA2_/MRDRNA2_123006_c0_seq1.p1  ORF type:complete len:415 (-),score=91.73 gnl/MRDRNA2_/MRDRNA2_123006_c0_seq1:381-1625(-)